MVELGTANSDKTLLDQIARLRRSFYTPSDGLTPFNRHFSLPLKWPSRCYIPTVMRTSRTTMAAIQRHELIDPRIPPRFGILNEQADEHHSLDLERAIVGNAPMKVSKPPAPELGHWPLSVALHCWPRGYPSHDDL